MLEIHIVIAASASGKSTFIQRHPTVEIQFVNPEYGDDKEEDQTFSTLASNATSDSLLFDGDDFVFATVGWPDYSDWYMEAESRLVSFVNLLEILTMAQRIQYGSYKRAIIYFNGNLRDWKFVDRYYGGYWRDVFNIHFHLVTIPVDDHKEYVAKRASAYTRGEAAHSFPGNWRNAHNNRGANIQDFKYNEFFFPGDVGWSSFEDLLNAIEGGGEIGGPY